MDKVVHFEIPADNMARAQKFYADVFGWQFQSMPGEGDYALAQTVESDEKGQPAELGGINGAIPAA